MGDEWPTVASEYQIIEQIGQVRGCDRGHYCLPSQ